MFLGLGHYRYSAFFCLNTCAICIPRLVLHKLVLKERSIMVSHKGVIYRFALYHCMLLASTSCCTSSHVLSFIMKLPTSITSCVSDIEIIHFPHFRPVSRNMFSLHSWEWATGRRWGLTLCYSDTGQSSWCGFLSKGQAVNFWKCAARLQTKAHFHWQTLRLVLNSTFSKFSYIFPSRLCHVQLLWQMPKNWRDATIKYL